MSLHYDLSFVHNQVKPRAIEAKKRFSSKRTSRLFRDLQCSVPAKKRIEKDHATRFLFRRDKRKGTMQKKMHTTLVQHPIM